ncbi:hypothetical protein N7533_010464 [Penicillium manginii]|uniref:uncharacterized protein n=1 Tax=Penicillium manginii TaxID=203109 RepID=UPI002548CD26|nr:uncharacterized protein N7533_010464 [Penicillium manginii]KAJ5743362.1 hypothetical protein N7533_010464 [Penicillium manginii]
MTIAPMQTQVTKRPQSNLTAKNPDLEIADGLLKTWNAYHHGSWRGSISAKKKLKPHSWQTLNIQGAFERFMLLSNDK